MLPSLFIVCLTTVSLLSSSLILVTVAESSKNSQYYQPSPAEIVQLLHRHASQSNIQPPKSTTNNRIGTAKITATNSQSTSEPIVAESGMSSTFEQLSNDPDLIRQIANRNYGIHITGRNLVSSNLPGVGVVGTAATASMNERVENLDIAQSIETESKGKTDIDRTFSKLLVKPPLIKGVTSGHVAKFGGLVLDEPKKCYVCQWNIAKCENFNCQNQPDTCTNNHFRAHKVQQQECPFGCEQFVVTDPNGLVQMWRRGCAPPNLPVKRSYRCASHYEFGIRIDQCICNRNHCNGSSALSTNWFILWTMGVLLLAWLKC